MNEPEYDDDPISPFAGGVTVEDIEMAFQGYLGSVLANTVATWQRSGPPPVAAYQAHIFNSFATGYGAGYRRARADMIRKAP
jgi:hypothetical protein